jgi:hypothetical protein
MSSTTPHTTRPGFPGRALAAGLSLATLLALPALAEVRVSGAPMAPGQSRVIAEPADRLLPSDGRGGETRLRIDQVERSSARGGIVNQLSIGTLTQEAQGEDAVSETIIGIIDGVEAEGSITNQVTIGTSTDIAIGAGARACSAIGTIGRASCR